MTPQASDPMTAKPSRAYVRVPSEVAGAEGMIAEHSSGAAVGVAGEGLQHGEIGAPRQAGELLEQVSVVEKRLAQCLGQAHDEMPMRDGLEGSLDQVFGTSEDSALGATRTEPPPFAAKRHEVVGCTVLAEHPRDSASVVAARQVFIDRLPDHGSPEAVFLAERFVVDLLERIEVCLDKLVEWKRA